MVSALSSLSHNTVRLQNKASVPFGGMVISGDYFAHTWRYRIYGKPVEQMEQIADRDDIPQLPLNRIRYQLDTNHGHVPIGKSPLLSPLEATVDRLEQQRHAETPATDSPPTNPPSQPQTLDPNWGSQMVMQLAKTLQDAMRNDGKFNYTPAPMDINHWATADKIGSPPQVRGALGDCFHHLLHAAGIFNAASYDDAPLESLADQLKPGQHIHLDQGHDSLGQYVDITAFPKKLAPPKFYNTTDANMRLVGANN